MLRATPLVHYNQQMLQATKFSRCYGRPILCIAGARCYGRPESPDATGDLFHLPVFSSMLRATIFPFNCWTSPPTTRPGTGHKCLVYVHLRSTPRKTCQTDPKKIFGKIPVNRVAKYLPTVTNFNGVRIQIADIFLLLLCTNTICETGWVHP